MSTASIAWPRKTRELMNHRMDSTVWNDFDFRDNDVVVATYAKSGTTWTQQIVRRQVGGSPGLQRRMRQAKIAIMLLDFGRKS